MAVQSVPSLMGVTKQPYGSFSGKSAAVAVVKKRRHTAASILRDFVFAWLMI